jgi:protein-disulfide isomerase
VIGGESVRAAEAAACADEQDQFWPYHHVLFANQRGENQGAFRDDALKGFAAALGLDESAFNDCLDSDRYRDQVQAETAAGRQRDVKSTPTFFINGELVAGAIPFDQLQSLIQAELDKASE